MQEFSKYGNQLSIICMALCYFYDYALAFSVITITLEVVVWRCTVIRLGHKDFSADLLLLIIFFTFLTGYACTPGK